MKISTAMTAGIVALGLGVSGIALAGHTPGHKHSGSHPPGWIKVKDAGMLTTKPKTVTLTRPGQVASYRIKGPDTKVAFHCMARPVKYNSTPHVGEKFLYVYGVGNFKGNKAIGRPIMSGPTKVYHWHLTGDRGRINVMVRHHTESYPVKVSCRLLGMQRMPPPPHT